MTDERLAALLQLQSVELTDRGAFCLDDREIAEYFDGELRGADLERVERHLQACSYCLARVGLLDRLSSGGVQRPVPEAVLATAKQLETGTNRQGLRQARIWATAAVLVLGVLTAVTLDRDPPDRQFEAIGNGTSPQGSTRTLRSVTAPDSRFGISLFLPETPLSPGSVIRWTEPADPLRYELSVLSVAGDIVWTERLAVNEWILNGVEELEPGAEYFLHVEAVLRDGRVLSSRHALLRMAEEP